MRITILALFAAFGLTACSSLRSHKQLDFYPFTKQTVQMVIDIKAEVDDSRPAMLRPYLTSVQDIRFFDSWQRMKKIVMAVVVYSTELSNLSDSRMTNKDQLKQLASLVEALASSFREEGAHRLNFSEQQFKDLLSEIKSQKNLMDGLNSATPVINDLTRISMLYLDDIGVQQREMLDSLDMEIAADYNPLLEYLAANRKERGEVLLSIKLLDGYLNGVPADTSVLFDRHKNILADIGRTSSLSREGAKEVQARLEKRFFALEKIDDSNKEDLKTYQLLASEANALRLAISNAGKNVRAGLTVWNISHRQLALGVTIPPQVNLWNIAASAAKKVAPIPLP